jgi:hypothetical protein
MLEMVNPVRWLRGIRLELPQAVPARHIRFDRRLHELPGLSRSNLVAAHPVERVRGRIISSLRPLRIAGFL